MKNESIQCSSVKGVYANLVEKKEQLVSDNGSHCGYFQKNILDVEFLL